MDEFQELRNCWQMLSPDDRYVLLFYARLLTEESMDRVIGGLLRYPDIYVHAVHRPGATADYPPSSEGKRFKT
jgi:hypothetical protein